MKFQQSDKIKVIKGSFKGKTGMVAEVLTGEGVFHPYVCYLYGKGDRPCPHSFAEHEIELESEAPHAD